MLEDAANVLRVISMKTCLCCCEYNEDTNEKCALCGSVFSVDNGRLIADCPHKNDLLHNIDELHTTELGAGRIRRGFDDYKFLGEAGQPMDFCRRRILQATKVDKQGKNYYIEFADGVMTVHAKSYTIITAKKTKALPKNDLDGF